MANMGKRFEQDFLSSFKEARNVSIDRFYDVWGNRKNISNVSDYVAYKFPHQYYFELKSYEGDYIPLSALSYRQYTGLLTKSKIDGVIAGALLNFRTETPQTFFVSIENIEAMRLSGVGGINIEKASQVGYEVSSKLKRTRYVYDVIDLMDALASEGLELNWYDREDDGGWEY